MPSPLDDDPSDDWDDDPATAIDLLPEDLAEIEREETTPTWSPTSPVDYERGRRDGARDERELVLGAVAAILGASEHVGRTEVARFLDLVRELLAQPAPRAPRP